jgi:hypothetical protein
MVDVDALELRRRKNSLRFGWHEKVLADSAARKRSNSVVLAGYIMHRFDVDKGYAEVSINQVARDLGMPRSTVIRSRDFLLQRGWIQIFERPKGPAGRHLALRYSLAGGPDDLLLEHHEPSVAHEP